jgi:hypothetical protein
MCLPIIYVLCRNEKLLPVSYTANEVLKIRSQWNEIKNKLCTKIHVKFGGLRAAPLQVGAHGVVP